MSQFESLADLISALAATQREVKVFAFESRAFVRVSAEAATVLAQSGEYIGGGNSHRCRYLRPVAAPSVPVIPEMDPRNSPAFVPHDSGFGFLRYPMPLSVTCGAMFPGLARRGAGL